MAVVSKSDVGLAESSLFNHHRFDNYGSWLDRELRNKKKMRGEPEGFGFAVPRPPAPARKEKAFIVQETSMTSGKLLNRRYYQKDTDYKLEALRSDPYHYPNHLQVEEDNHYEDRRARSQHIDPRVRAKNEIPSDKALRLAVPEEMVQNIIKAGEGSAKVIVNPDVMAIQFDPNIRPQPHTLHTLNADLSCCDLPALERPNLTATMSTVRSGRDWKWCLGGRPPPPAPDHGDVLLQKSQSTPGTLSGKSLLGHQKGAMPGPFHGSTFNPFDASMRVRGGKNAERGMAGTFPNKETRPGVN